jgi:heptosyltransferase-1
MRERTQADLAPASAPRLSAVRAIFIFAMNLLGDSICRLPVIAAAKRTYPDARVMVVADPRYRQVFDGQPFVDQVWELDRTGSRLHQAMAWLQLLAAARRARPDLVLDLYGSKRSALFSRLIGARWRVGLDRRGRSGWYNLRPTQFVSREGHIIQQMNAAVAAAGVAAEFRYVPLAVTAQDRAAAREALASGGLAEGESLVLLNPSARVAAKRWPAERFGELARALKSQVKVECGVITAPGEEAITQAAVAAANGTAVALPRLTIKQLAAALASARAIVTGDTGVLHLATAMGTPSVILAGPTDPKVVAYRGLRQAALFHRDACADWRGEAECTTYNECTKRRCIDAITVDEVAEAVWALL